MTKYYSKFYKNALVCTLCLFLVCVFDLASGSDSYSNNDSGAPSHFSVLVLGATGGTGKHVVQQFLEKDIPVHVIVRSKERMLQLLDSSSSSTSTTSTSVLLHVTEASLLNLSASELQEAVNSANVVISCLGHNMNFRGMYGHPRRLVTQATQRLTQAMLQAEASNPTGTSRKFILMGSDGVAHPAGSDDTRPFLERFLLGLVRMLVPPHSDNEAAAAYMHSLGADSAIEWCVVRPTDLIDGAIAKEYAIFSKPQGSLFGSGVATRATVAKLMVDLTVNPELWRQHKHRFPVIYDVDAAPDITTAEL